MTTRIVKFSATHIVCLCNNVALCEIVWAIDAQGAKTLDDVERLTDAGSVCQCCKSLEYDCYSNQMPLHVSEILTRYIRKKK